MSLFKSFILLLLLYNGSLFAQDFKSFIPKGFTLLDSASDDLNKDGYKDLVLVLNNVSDTATPESPRPVLILHGTKNKIYILAGRNDHIAYCENCGGMFGDPFDGIVIKNNYFSIQHYGGSNWRWSRIITFKYDPKIKTYVLHKDGGVSFNTLEPDKVTETLENQKDYDKMLFVNYKGDSN